MPSNVLRTTIPENNSLAPLVTGSDNGRAAARAKLAVSMNHVADTLDESSSYDDDDDSAVDAYMLGRNSYEDGCKFLLHWYRNTFWAPEH